jgi:hypothetical protein
MEVYFIMVLAVTVQTPNPANMPLYLGFHSELINAADHRSVKIYPVAWNNFWDNSESVEDRNLNVISLCPATITNSTGENELSDSYNVRMLPFINDLLMNIKSIFSFEYAVLCCLQWDC